MALSLPGVPKQSVAGLHLCPTTPAHSQAARQPLSNPQNLSTFVQASFPCSSLTTNRRAPVPLVNLPQAKCFFFSDLCCLESVHRGAWCDSLTGLLFRGGRASGSRLGQSRAWRLPSGWVVEYRQRDRDAEKSPGTDSYLGFLLCSSVITKLPSDWPDLLTFCLLRQCQKLFARPVCSCPTLSLLSHLFSLSSLSQPEPLQTHAPLHAASHKQ